MLRWVHDEVFELGGQEFPGAVEPGAEAGFVAVDAVEGAGVVAEVLAFHLDLHEGTLGR